MKKLYLASSIKHSGVKIGEEIEKDTGKKAKDMSLAFINTASEVCSDNKKQDSEDRGGLVKAGFNIFDYTVTGKNTLNFDKDLKDVDVIHVNGGNTFYLLLQVRKSGFDKWLRREVLSNGRIYVGSSAGAQILAPNIGILSLSDTKIYEKELKTFEGLGLVDFIVFPHWGSEKARDRYFSTRLPLAYKPDNKIILLTNNQYVRLEGGTYNIVDIRDEIASKTSNK